VNQGLYLDLKLFLEGIEVPVIGASVTATIGSPASANIEIVPDDSLDMLLPRTVVHLFYLDSILFRKSGRDTPSPGHYKLLFCGEVFSISSNKAGMGSRSATLSCLDFSNTLDTSFIYQLQLTSTPDAQNSIIRDTSRFLATDNTLLDNIINSPSDIIRRTSQSSASMPAHSGKKSLLGGLLAIWEVLHGVQGHYYGVNPWITVQERRVRFLDSVVGDDGTTASSVFESQQFSDWLTKRLSSPGQVMSFRQLTSILFEYIFYNMVPVPTARYIPGASLEQTNKPNRDIPKIASSVAGVVGELTDEERGEYDRFAGTKNLSLRKNFHDEVLPFLKELDDWAKKGITGGDPAIGTPSGRPAYVQLTSAYDEEEDLDGAKSAHNFGCAIDFVFNYSDGGTPTNAGSMGVSFGSRTVNKNAGRISHLSKPGEAILNTTGEGTWYHRLRHALFRYAQANPSDPTRKAGQVVWSGFYAWLLAEDMYAEHKDDIAIAIDYAAFCKKAGEIASKYQLKYLGEKSSTMGGGYVCPLMAALRTGSDPVHVQLKDWETQKSTIIAAASSLVGLNSEREALHSFVVRPDVWFAPAPKSNVIFPDMIQSFSTSREMLRETSRLQLDVGFSLGQGGNEVTTTYYYAPQFRDKTNIAPTLGEMAKNLYIFDHEKFSGVVPKFERMNDSIYFGLKSSDISDGQLTAAQRGSVSTLAPKVAHFHLLTSRYAARSASANLSFSPHIIPGFPAVVIDSTMTEAELNDAARTTASTSDGKKRRSFKIGMVQSITHSISQGGAQTQVRLSHVRSHRTGSESDDSFSESIGSDGILTIQDPVETSVQAFGNAERAIGGGISTFMLETSSGDDAFFWAAIAATCRKSSFYELVRDAPRESGDQGPVSSTGGRAIFQDEVDISIPETAYQKSTITSGTWSGRPTEVLIQIKNFEDLDSVMIADAVKVTIDKYAPSLGKEFEFEEYMNLTAFIREGTLCIPMVLPGDTFTGIATDPSDRANVLPVEEAIRPVWISDHYNATNITEKIYDPFFGTSAITDLVQDSRYSINSVEEAVDYVAAQYAASATTSPNILEWIHSFTRRPIADWPEILGSKGVFYDIKKGYVVEDSSPPSGEALKYNGGFHSNAVCFGKNGKYGSALEYLDLKGTQAVSKLSPDGEALFSLEGSEGDRMDPRLERAARVDLYKSRIQGVPGASGIGKRG
jgi:hypothetical protein